MNPTVIARKGVDTPRLDYEKHKINWDRCRAVCGSESQVKDHDIYVTGVDNFLIPFSPSMDQEQYNFLKREAELPGISAEFSQLLVGGLLRKEPEIKLPDDAPAGALEWITNEFGVDGTPITAFLLDLLNEEVVTSRDIIVMDFDDDSQVPYCTNYPAESLINWSEDNTQLTRAILVAQELAPGEDEFHPQTVDVIKVHELVDGKYRVRTFRQPLDANGKMITSEYREDAEPSVPLFNGEPMDFIPVWPANGSIKLTQPFLLTIVNKEINTYNKVARRNHLLYGAATYTPYVSGVDEDDFKKIVKAGLGSWVHLGSGTDAKMDVLKTPTDALTDLDRAVTSSIEEMAKLGVRMLSPETAQSGVALDIRNASQTARLGTLNTKVSAVMSQIIATMLNWRYGTEYTAEQVKFRMQDDFARAVQGEGWLRLATEWYESGKIPRSTWIALLKQNDVLPDDYNDDKGREEIDAETLEFRKQEESAYSDDKLIK